jgi:hypothetical protein
MWQGKIKDPGERRVGWGKYSLKKFKNVPTEYLEWFVKNSYEQMVDRKRWAEEELERRLTK